MSQEATARNISTTQKLGAMAYRMLCAVLRCTDIRVVALVGKMIGYITWALMPSRRRIVARNLRIAVNPRLRPNKLRAMVRRNIVRTSMNLACTLKTGLMTDKELKRAVTVIGKEEMAGKGTHGNCIIATIPHAGNWEVLARIRPMFSEVEHFGSMYRRLSNPLLEELVFKSRTNFGCEMFSKEDGLRSVLKLARTGGILGVLSDQFTQEGIFLPYFGKVTGTTPLPALLYKRSKGKGSIYAIATRNTALGKWDVNLTREVHLPDNCEDLAAITYEVNKALEDCQKENILDGFWMHHRWKATGRFAPECSQEEIDLISQHATLPYRIIIAVQEQWEEALLLIPMMRILKNRRPDMELTVICPCEQKAFWQTQSYITHCVTSDDKITPLQQLEEEEIYAKGPFDTVFLFSENPRVYRSLRQLHPVYFSGFGDENRFIAKERRKGGYARNRGTETARHRIARYKDLLHNHRIITDQWDYATPDSGNPEAQGNYIAPFSSLGEADSWALDKWKELVEKLQGKATLLALEADSTRAQAMAKELGIPCICTNAVDIQKLLGPNCKLYAVDGILPQLAALCNCPCRVIMASRLAAQYAPLGTGHRVYTNHTPCHPCYRTTCDQATPCHQGISVDALLED